MNPILASLPCPVSGSSAVASFAGVRSLRSLAAALSGCAGPLAVFALAFCATPAEAARAKYETANVTLSLAGKKLPEGVYLSGPISRMPAFYPTGESSRIVRNTYGDVLISGRLPVPEEVEKWFSTMEASRDARERLSIELTNLSREVLCSWDVLDAIPYKLEVSLQDQEQVWTVHVSTREIRYFGPGSTHNSSGGTTSSAAAASASNRSTNSGASGAESSRSGDPSTGGTSAITGNPSSSRSGSTSRSVSAGNIESRLPGPAPVIRPPALPTPSGTEYAVTTTDGKVHQVANIIPSDDRKQITLVMADQRRVTFDRTQIKKIDRLARR